MFALNIVKFIVASFHLLLLSSQTARLYPCTETDRSHGNPLLVIHTNSSIDFLVFNETAVVVQTS